MTACVIPMLLGTTDETYGVAVWVARIENLQSHLRIIRDHLPEDAAWLLNQVRCAMDEADRYVADSHPAAHQAATAEQRA